eukprot:1135306-Rhodomonas_salina.3
MVTFFAPAHATEEVQDPPPLSCASAMSGSVLGCAARTILLLLHKTMSGTELGYAVSRKSMMTMQRRISAGYNPRQDG